MDGTRCLLAATDTQFCGTWYEVAKPYGSAAPSLSTRPRFHPHFRGATRGHGRRSQTLEHRGADPRLRVARVAEDVWQARTIRKVGPWVSSFRRPRRGNRQCNGCRFFVGWRLRHLSRYSHSPNMGARKRPRGPLLWRRHQGNLVRGNLARWETRHGGRR